MATTFPEVETEKMATAQQTPAKYVFFFGGGKAEGDGKMKEVLGGKGAGLAEMTNAGLPVPPGFTIQTEACREFMKTGKTSAEVDRQMKEALRSLETLQGQKLGANDNPLLVSVRSGAKFSMPGMMDTILNLGLNDKTVEALATQSNNPRFAYDSYRRFIQMYGDVVFGLKSPAGDMDPFERVLDTAKHRRKAKRDIDLDADELKAVCAKFRQIVERGSSRHFPESPWDQLWGAVEAVFRSWQTKRASDYRRVHR